MEKGMTGEEANKLEEELWNNPDLIINAKPIYSALLFFITLTTRSFGRTHIISSCPPHLRDVNLQWCRLWFSGNPFFMPDQVWIRSNEEISGDDYKIDKIRVVGSHMHIDDSLEISKRVRDETKAHPVLLQSTQMLRGEEDLEGISVIERRPDGQSLLDIYKMLLTDEIFPEI